MKRKRAKYTTGILRKAPRTKFALVDVVNLNRAHSRIVTVQVFDWSNGSPIALNIIPYGTKRATVKVGPNQSVYLYADVSKVKFKYEVRVTQANDRSLITNVTGVTRVVFAPQQGDTVLQHELVKIK